MANTLTDLALIYTRLLMLLVVTCRHDSIRHC